MKYQSFYKAFAARKHENPTTAACTAFGSVLQQRAVRGRIPDPSGPTNPAGVLERGHAGFVINKLSLGRVCTRAITKPKERDGELGLLFAPKEENSLITRPA